MEYDLWKSRMVWWNLSFKEIVLAKQITSLIHKTSISEIQITKVSFLSHYEIKGKESSAKKEHEILEMHNII